MAPIVKQFTGRPEIIQKETTDISNGVQSVSRALDLLEVSPKHGPELGLTKIAIPLHENIS